MVGSIADVPNIMKCGQCGKDNDKVVDSRTSKDGFSIRRRRECTECGNRFTTYEHLEQTTMLIVKQTGIREPFERSKLLNGFLKACEKRPVGLHLIEQAVDEILTELRSESVREIPTRVIGAMVMDKLREIDHVAYVRFASVYRQFEVVGEFLEEIQALDPEASKKHQSEVLQAELFSEA